MDVRVWKRGSEVRSSLDEETKITDTLRVGKEMCVLCESEKKLPSSCSVTSIPSLSLPLSLSLTLLDTLSFPLSHTKEAQRYINRVSSLPVCVGVYI